MCWCRLELLQKHVESYRSLVQIQFPPQLNNNQRWVDV